MDIQGMMWQEGWKPTNDIEISQMLKLLTEKKKESDRIVASVKAEIEMLEQLGKAAEESYLKLESRINYLCERYVLDEVDEEDRKETSTQIKYRVARGEIIVKKPSKTILKPTKEDEIYLLAQYPEYVRNEPVLKWGDLKANLEINEKGQVVDKRTGKIVEGVPISEIPQAVSIKLNI